MIYVNNLTKQFHIPQKHPGLLGFIKDIAVRKYSILNAVDSISFSIPQGELIGFLGPNGAGKTTTLKMLSGILYPTKGEVNILGFTPFEKKHEFLKEIAFVMGQKSQLFWELPAEDTFILNKEIYEVSTKHYQDTLTKLTRLLDCKSLIHQPVKTLSLGQRMKMELIAALIHRPKVLFLDEPTIGLDVVAQKTMRDFIKDYKNLHGATILLTSHYMEDVKALAQRVMIIDKGKIIYDGLFDKLIKKYATKKTIEIIVEEMPKVKDLEKINIKARVNFPRINFKVDRDQIPLCISTITKHLNFVDINIYEERVEDIIRKIFSKSVNQ